MDSGEYNSEGKEYNQFKFRRSAGFSKGVKRLLAWSQKGRLHGLRSLYLSNNSGQALIYCSQSLG